MDKEYKIWIHDLKRKIRSAQLKASVAVNEEMILLYWDIGQGIVEKQQAFAWGSKVVELIAKDLKRELPGTNGFSRTNLFAMRKFYLFYKDSDLVQQAVGQLEKRSDDGSKQSVRQAAGQLEEPAFCLKFHGGIILLF